MTRRCHQCRRPRLMVVLERQAVLDDPESFTVYDIACEHCGAIHERQVKLAA